jgi:peptide/nickel transport system substrate-binding protein
MAAPEDRKFTIRLTRKFSLVLNCLSKIGPPALVIMPERLASTDPYQALKEIVGSGPFRFVPDERVVGSKVVYVKNNDYVPRPGGTTDWLAGPKIVHFDRVEWHVMPDTATAAAALENAEVDWWENPPVDLLAALAGNAGVRIEDTGPLGILGSGIFNHLHPPFDKPAVRRVIMEATSQADFMTAAAGTNKEMWRDGIGFFAPDTPMASDAGMDIFKGPRRDLGTLKKALRDAGYQNERIVMMSPSDQAVLTAECAVALDMFQKLGMDVQYEVMDWGTLVQRRAKKDPPDKGGWNFFITGWNGIDMTTPITNQTLRSNGAKAWFGWPDLPDVQGLIDGWVDASDVASQQKIAAALQRKAFEQMPYLPTGQYFQRTACRQNITGIIEGQFVFWNVRRT